MSWSYSRALVAEYSDRCSWGIGPCAPLNTTPTPDQFYWPDKTTEHSRLSRFGMTLEPLTADRGEELLTLFLEDSRARTLALPETGLDWTASGQGYGEKWRGLLGRFDPVSCSLKTAQLSFIEDLTECCPTLPRWGLMLAGELYPQPIPALCISESVSGCWPTPTVCGNYNRKGASKTSGDGLATAVRNWPTPQASDNRDRGNLSTPAISRRVEKGKQVMLSMCVSSENGRLNPDWVEWLMGWPIGQTDLKPLATGRFHEFVQQHGESFPVSEAA